MTSLKITIDSIPRLDGKVAIITVHILDIFKPSDEELAIPNLTYHACDISKWSDLLAVFKQVGTVDFAFANAGISETFDVFADEFNEAGELKEPNYPVLDVNLKSVLNFVKIAWSTMKRNGTHGSIVITTSATGYVPEQSLPVYAAGKAALMNLIRALRSITPLDNITINGVAPAATVTRLLPSHLAAPIIAQGLPVSSSEFVGLALVYSATATQDRRVQAYGKEKDEEGSFKGRWNGRVILTLGDQYTEIEEPLSRSREIWWGKRNLELTRAQQAVTDFRGM
ncbi:NAD(P)-binding protein [Amniculicola lignicola CBS 123094]|uniref:NAD(P)-binding protein n=1 Tax=Amniculicola lignicola CBS 123094 TaxID=1392246 RepID=A0A6A5VX46_9PLEO|nr:NAD(P)-binding protein [Amniculicola lignicola CBS 123094]